MVSVTERLGPGFEYIWARVSNAARAIKDNVVTYSTGFFDYLKNYTMKELKPIYEYRIKPINRNDVLLASAGLIGGIVFRQAAFLKFGKPILAMGNFGMFATTFGACYHANQRICQESYDQTWDKLESLRQKIFNLSHKKRNFDPCVAILKDVHNDLQFKPSPEKIPDDIDKLNRQVTNYTDKLHQPNIERYKRSVIIRIEHMLELFAADENTVTLLKVFKAEINKIGTTDENLDNAKKSLLKMSTIQNLNREYELLNRDYDDLLASLSGIDSEKTKENIINEVERILKVLNRHRKIPSLKKDGEQPMSVDKKVQRKERPKAEEGKRNTKKEEPKKSESSQAKENPKAEQPKAEKAKTEQSKATPKQSAKPKKETPVKQNEGDLLVDIEEVDPDGEIEIEI